jgi:hypothetical protein
MRNVAKALTVLGLAMIGLIIWRMTTGGPPGPKTYTLIAGAAVVLIAAMVLWRREAPPTVAPPPPR